MNFLESFMPHGMCYAWRPDILWLHVFSDAAIAIAYFTIPYALVRTLRKRKYTPFRGTVVMFSIFILACGVTHAMSIVVVWNGYYAIQGVFKAITAIASIGTAIMLYPIMPQVFALRSPVELELEESNSALQQEMDQRKRTEEQSLELQNELAHIGRLTTMGQMATGLAHELNQPLLAISQSADTALLSAQENASTSAELLECLEDIQSQTQRAGEIIRALRQFVSKDTATRSDLDLNSLVEQTIRLLNSDALKHNVKIESDLNPIPNPNVDRVQIAQVLVNLLRNSIDAVGANHSHNRRTSVGTHLDGEEIVVVVKDNGPGLDDGIVPFKPFESSKSEGMGMGLSISRSIVESHGGKLWFEEAAGIGTRFIFTLPLTRS